MVNGPGTTIAQRTTLTTRQRRARREARARVSVRAAPRPRVRAPPRQRPSDFVGPPTRFQALRQRAGEPFRTQAAIIVGPPTRAEVQRRRPDLTQPFIGPPRPTPTQRAITRREAPTPARVIRRPTPPTRIERPRVPTRITPGIGPQLVGPRIPIDIEQRRREEVRPPRRLPFPPGGDIARRTLERRPLTISARRKLEVGLEEERRIQALGLRPEQERRIARRPEQLVQAQIVEELITGRRLRTPGIGLSPEEALRVGRRTRRQVTEAVFIEPPFSEVLEGTPRTLTQRTAFVQRRVAEFEAIQKGFDDREKRNANVNANKVNARIIQLNKEIDTLGKIIPKTEKEREQLQSRIDKKEAEGIRRGNVLQDHLDARERASAPFSRLNQKVQRVNTQNRIRSEDIEAEIKLSEQLASQNIQNVIITDEGLREEAPTFLGKLPGRVFGEAVEIGKAGRGFGEFVGIESERALGGRGDIGKEIGGALGLGVGATAGAVFVPFIAGERILSFGAFKTLEFAQPRKPFVEVGGFVLGTKEDVARGIGFVGTLGVGTVLGRAVTGAVSKAKVGVTPRISKAEVRGRLLEREPILKRPGEFIKPPDIFRGALRVKGKARVEFEGLGGLFDERRLLNIRAQIESVRVPKRFDFPTQRSFGLQVVKKDQLLSPTGFRLEKIAQKELQVFTEETIPFIQELRTVRGTVRSSAELSRAGRLPRFLLKKQPTTRIGARTQIQPLETISRRIIPKIGKERPIRITEAFLEKERLLTVSEGLAVTKGRVSLLRNVSDIQRRARTLVTEKPGRITARTRTLLEGRGRTVIAPPGAKDIPIEVSILPFRFDVVVQKVLSRGKPSRIKKGILKTPEGLIDPEQLIKEGRREIAKQVAPQIKIEPVPKTIIDPKLQQKLSQDAIILVDQASAQIGKQVKAQTIATFERRTAKLPAFLTIQSEVSKQIPEISRVASGEAIKVLNQNIPIKVPQPQLNLPATAVEPVIAEEIISATAQKVFIAQIPKSVQVTLPKLGQEQITKTIQKVTSKQLQGISQGIATIQKVSQVNIQKVSQANVQKLKTAQIQVPKLSRPKITTLIDVPFIPLPPRVPPFLPPPRIGEAQVSKVAQQFIVEPLVRVITKKRGKEVFLFPRALPESIAKARAAQIIDITARASFKIVPTGEFTRIQKRARRTPAFQRFQQIFRPGKEPGFFVERVQFRISTPGELREITQKGLAKLREQRGLKLEGFNLDPFGLEPKRKRKGKKKTTRKKKVSKRKTKR